MVIVCLSHFGGGIFSPCWYGVSCRDGPLDRHGGLAYVHAVERHDARASRKDAPTVLCAGETQVYTSGPVFAHAGASSDPNFLHRPRPKCFSGYHPYYGCDWTEPHYWPLARGEVSYSNRVFYRTSEASHALLKIWANPRPSVPAVTVNLHAEALSFDGRRLVRVALIEMDRCVNGIALATENTSP